MKILIVWAGKYGFTQKCAKLLKEKLSADTEIMNAKEAKELPETYDAVILGSSVYAGNLRKELLGFIEHNREKLKRLKLGVFLSGFDEDYDQYIKKNLDEELYKHISVKGRFGYGFDFKKLGFFERNIIRMVSKKKESTEFIDEKAIKIFADNVRKNG